ncbi:MAG: amidophosphoribosyltransferase [Actinobacteria bacterium RBG_19FT_COMBO_54_7]|nr:MAG: amidophosphoribosyltransferase [Actinobacteria bacterium RBG_19FT_COMBO_54_7]
MSLEINESCGVFGIYAPGEDVAKLTYYALYALQHRGQESAGIAVSDGREVLLLKDMGMVSQVFSERDLLNLKGHMAMGHVRYSTTGSSFWENAQPVQVPSRVGSVLVAHNGNLVNTDALRNKLKAEGVRFRTTSDTEVIALMLARSQAPDIVGAVHEVIPQLIGAYSLAIMTEEKLIGIRDPYGIRPLCVGSYMGGHALASESCGLDIIGAEYLREIQPGEMAIFDKDGLDFQRIVEPRKPSLCIFEFIYFARPDSIMYDTYLYHARKHMGMSLADEGEVEADVVMPIPDTGVPAAIGYSEAAGIPFGEGLIKNRYVGRTFIQPTQAIRQLGIRLKLNPIIRDIQGKRLVVVDDSIVRGNTTKEIIKMLREAGAKEVHMRISSPPDKYPCFYGIDTAIRKELIASSRKVEEIRKFIGADTLHYLSIDNLVSATRRPREDFCMACFDGDYPVPVPDDLKMAKGRLEDGKVGIKRS